MGGKALLTFCMAALLSSGTVAQLKVPPFEIDLKGGVFYTSFLNDLVGEMEYVYAAPIWSAGINFHISQRIALGGYYSGSIGGNVTLRNDYNGNNIGSFPSAHQVYGVQLRFSAGRNSKVRPYILATIANYEMFIDHESYRIANSSLVYGGALGLMLRLNNALYLTLPEIAVRMRTEGFYFEDSMEPMAEIKVGISYNFSKRK
ncbi:hypothetical protein QQ054_21330 [Oscillatoria amoena NRMC-F 0135]|nr:hypothetical protein [Oscillatoria amoena NRMC-F 0135]